MELERKFNLVDVIPVTITWMCIIAQIVLTFVLWDNFYELGFLVYIGYALWALGAIFGIVPIIQFRLKGGVEKGKSYVQTKRLVTTGLYAIVRHPQYIASIIISMALVCMSQHWVVIVLLLPPIVLTYIDTRRADKALVIKFGEEYELYQKEVPRMMPLYGILKLLIRKLRK